jgi:hypothetical protein
MGLALIIDEAFITTGGEEMVDIVVKFFSNETQQLSVLASSILLAKGVIQ